MVAPAPSTLIKGPPMKHIKTTCRISRELALELEKVDGEEYKDMIKAGLSKSISEHIIELVPLPMPSSNSLGELQYELSIHYYSEYEHQQTQKDLLELKHYKELCESSYGKLVQRRIDEEVLQLLL